MKAEIKVADFILSGEYTEDYITRKTIVLIMDKEHKLLGKVNYHVLRTAIDAIHECTQVERGD